MARILIVDDHPDNLELMRYLLLAYGHSVLEAPTGALGLAVAAAEQPDLILCDIQLPDIGGEEVCRRLKADPATADLPVIAVTSFAMVGDRERLLAGGFDGYLAKPLSPETFVQSVEAHLGPSAPVSLPTSHATSSRADAATAAPSKAGRRRATTSRARSTSSRILVVDDNAPNRQLLADLLVGAGYEVEACASATAALQAIDRALPRLVISDVHMRPQDGFALFRTVGANPGSSALRFMFISNSVWGAAEVQRGLAMGAKAFVLRPVEPQVLLAEVERVFHGD